MGGLSHYYVAMWPLPEFGWEHHCQANGLFFRPFCLRVRMSYGLLPGNGAFFIISTPFCWNLYLTPEWPSPDLFHWKCWRPRLAAGVSVDEVLAHSGVSPGLASLCSILALQGLDQDLTVSEPGSRSYRNAPPPLYAAGLLVAGSRNAHRLSRDRIGHWAPLNHWEGLGNTVSRLQSKPRGHQATLGRALPQSTGGHPSLRLQDHRTVHCCPLPALPQTPV